MDVEVRHVQIGTGMRLSKIFAFSALPVVLSTAACTSSGSPDAASSESNLATRAFQYTCTTPDARILEEAA